MKTKVSLLQQVKQYLGEELTADLPPTPFVVMARVLSALYPARVPYGADDDTALLRSLTADLLDDQGRVMRAVDAALQEGRFGLTPGQVVDVRQTVGAFLAWHRDRHRTPNARNVDLRDSWRTLLEVLKGITGPGHPIGSQSRLGKFAAFCSIQGIDVKDLTTAATEAYWDWLHGAGGVQNPRHYYTETRRVWGILADLDRVPSVDFFDLPREHALYGLAPEGLPEYWCNVVTDLAARMRSGEPEDAHLHLSESAAASSTGVLRRLLGFTRQEMDADLEELDLAGLFGGRDYVIGLLRFLEGRKGRSARHHVDQLEQLHRIAQRYAVETLGLDIDASWMLDLRQKLRRDTRRDTMEAPPSEEELLATLAGLADDIERGRREGWSPGTLLVKERDRFMMSFFVHCGSRRGDLVRARLDDVVRRGGSDRLVIATKNSAEDSVSMVPAVSRALRSYLTQREALGIDNDSLLVTRTGKAMNPVQVHQQVARCFKTYTGKAYSVHAIRHAFAVNDVRQHGDIHLTAARMDLTPGTASSYYDRALPAEYAPVWHNLLKETREGRTRELRWVTQLIERCVEDPGLREMVVAASERHTAPEEV